MAKPTSLPDAAVDNAASQAVPYLPTELPPPPPSPPDVTLPGEALDNILGIAQLPDWLS